MAALRIPVAVTVRDFLTLESGEDNGFFDLNIALVDG